MELTNKALELIKAVFSENSNIQMPVSHAKEVLEIREWVNTKI